MIKEQYKLQEYYCLNPFCLHKNQRVFSQDNSHFNLEQCKNWIIKDERLFDHQHQSFNIREMNNISINFQQQPLEAFQTLERLSLSGWKKVLENEEAKTKKQICRSIEVQFQALRIKMQQLLDKSNLIQNIRDIIKKQQCISTTINDYYEKNIQQLSSLHNKILFKKVELKEKIQTIKEEVRKIFESVIEDKTPINKILSNQQKRSFHQYIFEVVNQSHNKLQQIASVLNKDPPRYYTQNEKLCLKCIICGRVANIQVTPANKKMVKKQLAQQILQHIYSHHYEETGFAYSRKITKSNIIYLKFEQFLEQSKGFNKIQIIDRQSGVQFEQSYIEITQNPLNFTIEIISTKNIAMAKSKYILVESNQSIDSLISIISYICSQRDQNVEIFTKKPYLKNGIQSLIWCKTDRPEQKLKGVKTQAQI